jgi:hypothetical protein
MTEPADGQAGLLVRGYGRVRPLDPASLEWPLFLKWRDLLIYAFFHEQLEVGESPGKPRQTFLGMRAWIEADRPIAEHDDAR